MASAAPSVIVTPSSTSSCSPASDGQPASAHTLGSPHCWLPVIVRRERIRIPAHVASSSTSASVGQYSASSRRGTRPITHGRTGRNASKRPKSRSGNPRHPHAGQTLRTTPLTPRPRGLRIWNAPIVSTRISLKAGAPPRAPGLVFWRDPAPVTSRVIVRPRGAGQARGGSGRRSRRRPGRDLPSGDDPRPLGRRARRGLGVAGLPRRSAMIGT